MRVYRMGMELDFEAFDIAEARSTFYNALSAKFRTSDTGRWFVPTRFGTMRPRPLLVVRKCREWPDLLTGGFFGFVVSERCAAILREAPDSQVEIFPVEVEGPRRAGIAPAYYFVNVHKKVDAANLRAMHAHPDEEYPDMKSLSWTERGPGPDRRWIVDPDRVPARCKVFTLKYVGGVFVTEALRERLLRAKLSYLSLAPVKLLREDEAQRRALLAEFRRICRAYRPPPEPEKITSVRALESRLGVRLPEKFGRFQRESKEFVFKGGEVFDLSQTATHTRDLREWKELDWPEHLVVISDDGRGGYFALDTSKVGDGDCPVVYFDHELATVDRKTGRITPELEAAAPTFEAWVSRLKRGGSPLPR